MAKEKRVRIEMEPFITAWEQSKNVKEVADRLGIKVTSVMARASKYRGEPFNIPLKTMPRGGGAKLDVAAAKELLAKLRGKTVAEVNTASAALATKHAEKAAG
jgi:transposase